MSLHDLDLLVEPHVSDLGSSCNLGPVIRIIADLWPVILNT